MPRQFTKLTDRRVLGTLKIEQRRSKVDRFPVNLPGHVTISLKEIDDREWRKLLHLHSQEVFLLDTAMYGSNSSCVCVTSPSGADV
jgi:hypothetical protein